MKVIELTEKHKTKLLEMCNKLFSSEGIFFTINCGDIYYSKNGKYPGKSIHWFEFCMTHLVEKIIATFITTKDGDKIYKRTLNDDLSNFFISSLSFSRGYNKKHPVDYLYEKFKKLK
jgi:hypothetical protein